MDPKVLVFWSDVDWHAIHIIFPGFSMCLWPEDKHPYQAAAYDVVRALSGTIIPQP
jgi:hypothetical protein